MPNFYTPYKSYKIDTEKLFQYVGESIYNAGKEKELTETYEALDKPQELSLTGRIIREVNLPNSNIRYDFIKYLLDSIKGGYDMKNTNINVVFSIAMNTLIGLGIIVEIEEE